MRSLARRVAVPAALLSLLAAAHGSPESEVDYAPPVAGPIARHFEPPPTPYAAGHRGIDIEVPEGTLVLASAAGLVAFAGAVGGGLFVSVDHEDGLRSTYSFLRRILVKRGERVEQGRALGESGAGHPGEGRPALHFGLRRGDDYLDPEHALLRGLRRNVWRAVRLAAPAGG